MKRIILLLQLFLLILCSCSFITSNSKGSSTLSSSINNMNTISSFEIRRKSAENKMNENLIFTNGGFNSFEVVAKNDSGDIINISSSSVSWKSSNKSIFDVDSSGNVTGKSNGEAILSATYNSYEAYLLLNVKTIAKTFNKKENEIEYRKGSTYSFPLELTPQNASLSIEISNPNIIKLSSNNNSFTVIGVGTCNISITAYTSYHGDTKTYEYQITTLDYYAPVFYFNNQKTNKGEISFAVNKYTSFSFSSWGIKAISFDEKDLSSSIEYYSGEYDFTNVGEYSIMLIAKDLTKNACSFFNLIMIITEYEEVAVQSPNKAFEISITSYEFINVSDESYFINGIIFSIDITLISAYEYAIGTIYWDICFYIEEASNGKPLPYNEKPFTYTIKCDKDTPKTQTLTARFDYKLKLNPDTFSMISSSVYLSGNAYYYSYY